MFAPIRRLLPSLWLATGCLFALMALPASSQAASEAVFADYFHTAWRPGDGAPNAIRGIVQDRDGWLWLGGTGGLYRFDGERFERMLAVGGHKLRKSNILALGLIGDTLWVGYQFGGIERFSGGSATYYDQAAGLPQGSVQKIIGGPDGKVVAATSAGLFAFDGQRWSRQWPAADRPPSAAKYVFATADHALIFMGDNAVWRRPAGSAVFTKLASDDPQIVTLLEGPDGDYFAGGLNVGFMRYAAGGQGFRRGLPTHATDTASWLFFQRDGTPWMVVAGGIQLLTETTTFHMKDQLTRERGLSDSNVLTKFEDREGNFWLGTSGGLDRLRRNKVHALALPPDTFGPAIAAGDDGSVWVGSQIQTPLRRWSSAGKLREGTLQNVQSLLRGSDGAIWAANEHSVVRYDKAGEQRWALPADSQDQVQTMAQDRDGSIWLSIVGKRALARLRQGNWDTAPPPQGFPGTAISLTVDDDNRLWSGYTDNRVAVLDGDQVTRYTDKNGLRTGNVLTVATRGSHVWVGGEQALMFLDGANFVALRAEDGSDFLGVSGIVETKNGDLWLHGLNGITHIAAADLQRALRGPNRQVAFERLGYEDGIVGQVPQIRPTPTLVEAADGRLWLNTASGIGWFDPQRLRRNTQAAVVQVLALIVDGRPYPATSPQTLPEHPANVRIDYTALSLRMPQRVRFRYRLAGIDAAWTDAGNRRSAFYNHLGAGQYRFEVAAVNEDGVASANVAALEFTVTPSLPERLWFRLLCAALVLMAVWLLFRLHFSNLGKQMRARLHARMDERERIARELHDTLLQSIQGLILKVHAAAMLLHDTEPARAALQEALQRADEAVLEGRNRVRDLRGAHSAELMPLLQSIGAEWSGAGGPTFDVAPTTAPRSLRPDICKEVFAIAREAISNAYQHAAAQAITVRGSFTDQEVRLTIDDDGIGIPDSIRLAGGRTGHWGLVGMQERAARIGAHLALESHGGAPRGTRWTLTLPAHRAYPAPHEVPATSFWRRLIGALTGGERE